MNVRTLLKLAVLDDGVCTSVQEQLTTHLNLLNYRLEGAPAILTLVTGQRYGFGQRNAINEVSDWICIK